jgi:uncharacterized protein (DUF486 family)
MTALLEKLLPVLLIIVIGWLMRKKNIISGSTINDLKQLILNLALPFTLFLSFSKTALEARYILIVVFVFLLCMIMYGFGFLLKHRQPAVFGSLYAPWFMSGFEFGMIGIGLFSALFGTENLPLITLIGLGHEFFAWFVAIPYVQFLSGGKFSLTETLGKFVRTPVILGILGGLIFNVTGAYAFLQTVFWCRAVLGAMLAVSNSFMTYAWYGHLRNPGWPIWKAVFLSWLIAFFEYCFMVPANRIGYGQFSITQLKVMQEAITLTVFTAFALLLFRERWSWNYLWSFGCLVAAVFFAFK